ncbi:MAG: hypothetical protein JXB48_04185 [Candidatus Latescibacteria bacterium]|nr:hypothetical protein [Candidatus Latescibacterota bacterium]
MTIFQPTNYLRDTGQNKTEKTGLTRYLRTDLERIDTITGDSTENVRNFTNRLQTSQDTTQPQQNDMYTTGNNLQTSIFISNRQQGIKIYRENNGTFGNNNGTLLGGNTVNSKAVNTLFNTNTTASAITSRTQNTGTNAGTLTTNLLNNAIREYTTFSSQSSYNKTTLQQDAGTYLRTRQATPLGAELVQIQTSQSQSALNIPPTLSYARSQGIDQYTLINSPIKDNGTVNRNTVDLYISTNPTQRLATQLLP